MIAGSSMEEDWLANQVEKVTARSQSTAVVMLGNALSYSLRSDSRDWLSSSVRNVSDVANKGVVATSASRTEEAKASLSENTGIADAARAGDVEQPMAVRASYAYQSLFKIVTTAIAVEKVASETTALTAPKTAETPPSSPEPQNQYYTPNRTLPTDEYGVPTPDTDLPHTQLGRSKPKYGSEPQARTWDYGKRPINPST